MPKPTFKPPTTAKNSPTGAFSPNVATLSTYLNQSVMSATAVSQTTAQTDRQTDRQTESSDE